MNLKYIYKLLTLYLVSGVIALKTVWSENSCENNGYMNLLTRRVVPRTNKILSKRDSEGSNKELDIDLGSTGIVYIATLQLGSNKDQVEVIIDTGSSDFWVPSVNNANCIPETNIPFSRKTIFTENNITQQLPDGNITDLFNCSEYGVFDPYISDTFIWNHTTFSIVYEDLSYAKGTWGIDNVYFNDNDIGQLNIAVCNETSTGLGVLGIGLRGSESISGVENGNHSNYIYENFPLKLVSNGVISRASYSIFLDQNKNAEILFGAVDHSKYSGSLYQFPMVNAYLTSGFQNISTVSITMNSIALVSEKESITIADGFFAAILDSGTTTAMLPHDVVSQIADYLELEYNDIYEMYITKCSSLENKLFSFNFQGINFNVPLTNFFIELADEDDILSGQCFLGIVETYLTGYIVLGDSFLNNVYMSVDIEGEMVALANVERSNASSDIEVIETGIPSATDAPITVTYDVDHMVYSTVGSTISAPSETLDYNEIFTNSMLVYKTSSMSSLSNISQTKMTSSIEGATLISAMSTSSQTLSSVVNVKNHNKSTPLESSLNSYEMILFYFFMFLCVFM